MAPIKHQRESSAKYKTKKPINSFFVSKEAAKSIEAEVQYWQKQVEEQNVSGFEE
jgi:hypothetical protein